MRSRIYAIVTKATREDWISKLYDTFICLITVLSLSLLIVLGIAAGHHQKNEKKKQAAPR